MRWLAIFLALLTLVAVGAGCGGGDDEATDDTELTTTETTDTDATTDETTTDETTSDTDTDTDIGTDFNFASEDCQGLVAAYVAISQAISLAGSQDVSGEVEKFREYAEQVPEEIRGDVEVLAAAYGEYINELQSIGLEAGETPSAEQLAQLQTVGQSLGSSEVQESSTRLSAWTEENCSG